MGKAPLFVRPPTDAERQALEDGLRSPDAFVLRRAQIILASAQGEPVGVIAPRVGFSGQAVRDVIHAFNAQGLACVPKQSTRPKSVEATLDASRCERLQHILHQSPRTYGKPTGVWTLALAAQVCQEQGVTERCLSEESIRRALQRLRTNWKRAKHWSTSPDPQYARKKSGVIA